MKRPLLIGCLASLLIVTGFSSCGKPPEVCDVGYYLSTPQLCADRSSLGFGQEFRTGTTIGTRPQDTIDIRNGGTADLQVSALAKSGDGTAAAFTYDIAYDLPDGGTGVSLPASIPGGKHLFIRVIFAPSQARAYNAQLTLGSNAGPEAITRLLDAATANGFTSVLTANQGQPAGGFVFLLSGCGVPSDGGTSPCYRDGGT